MQLKAANAHCLSWVLSKMCPVSKMNRTPLDPQHWMPESPCSRPSLLSCRQVGSQVWSQPQMVVGHQNGGKVTTVGMEAIADIGRSQRREAAGGEKESFATTRGDMSSVRQEQRLKESVQLLDVMEQRGFQAYVETCSGLLQRCTKMKSLADGKAIHAHIISSGFEPDTFLGNNLVSMYAKCGRMVDARRVFDKMPERNVITWNAMIAGLAQQGQAAEASQFFRKMLLEGVQPNKITFVSILNSFDKPVALEHGKQLHAGIMKAGFESDVRVGTALLSMYCKCGSVADACRVFEKLGERDLVAWTAMIAGYAQHGHVQEAFELFRQMQGEGLKPNKVTFICILNACANPEALEQGKRLHAGIVQAGLESDLLVGNSLISMYCKCGNVVNARQVFDNMPKRDVVSWTTMIAGSAQHGHGGEALELFRQMQREGVKPDDVTFSGILNACASLSALDYGKWVHQLLIKSEFASDVCVCNALVDMYAKCGELGDAREVFEKLVDRDVISWTAMIIGYAQHGYGKEALHLFQGMQREGVSPNGVTFIGVLIACSHVGLVDEGWHYFMSMRRDHNITPTRMHYGCMVDLLGRAGHLEEAEDFIKNMPFEADASVWGALACCLQSPW